MAGVNPFILGRAQYRVVAPVVVAKLISGGEQYVYEHGLLPQATRPSQIEELQRLGMIVEFGAVTA